MAKGTLTLDTKVTLREAYLVMFDFLDEHWKRTSKPDAIGGLLGDLSLLPGGQEPADPASYSNWLKSAKNCFGIRAN